MGKEVHVSGEPRNLRSRSADPPLIACPAGPMSKQMSMVPHCSQDGPNSSCMCSLGPHLRPLPARMFPGPLQLQDILISFQPRAPAHMPSLLSIWELLLLLYLSLIICLSPPARVYPLPQGTLVAPVSVTRTHCPHCHLPSI